MSKLSQKAYAYIKDQILSLQYEAGRRITEDMICNELELSRTPVREALQQLASEQLITIYPNRYAEVTSFDKDRIRRIGAIRLSLDMLSAYSCTYNGSLKDFNRLEAIEEAYEAALKRGNKLESIDWDCKFHLKIAEITTNRDLVRQQEELYPLIHVILGRMESESLEKDAQIAEHKLIIHAMRTQDMKALRSTLCQHLRRTHGFSDNFIKYWLE